jgi:hypothetical protein
VWGSRLWTLPQPCNLHSCYGWHGSAKMSVRVSSPAYPGSHKYSKHFVHWEGDGNGWYVHIEAWTTAVVTHSGGAKWWTDSFEGEPRERQMIDCCIFSFLEGVANHLVWWMWSPKGCLCSMFAFCRDKCPPQNHKDTVEQCIGKG